MDVTQSSATTNGIANATQPTSSRGTVSSDFETFLKMLTVQMQNQDPLNPIESSDYAVQLATFSGVEQQVRTNDLLASLSTQIGLTGISQFAGWVGMEALVQAPAHFDGQPISIVANPPIDAESVAVVVLDASGQEVHRTEIDPDETQFEWAGVDDSGQPFPTGAYSFHLEIRDDGQVVETVPVDAYSTITEARIINGHTRLLLEGGGEIAVDDVHGLRTMP